MEQTTSSKLVASKQGWEVVVEPNKNKLAAEKIIPNAFFLMTSLRNKIHCLVGHWAGAPNIINRGLQLDAASLDNRNLWVKYENAVTTPQ